MLTTRTTLYRLACCCAVQQEARSRYAPLISLTMPPRVRGRGGVFFISIMREREVHRLHGSTINAAPCARSALRHRTIVAMHIVAGKQRLYTLCFD